ncbi:MAG TPA: radical SAM protein [Chloroflexota bacterium]|nr:radical SAM protein [Chloroflexota bacterium]
MENQPNLYELLQEQAQRSQAPWAGTLELTYRCNERCGMCYLGPDWGKGRKKDELTTGEVFDLLRQLREAGCFELLLTGGEICLRKDLLRIIDHAGSLGFLLTVKTNGTMVTEELALVLRRNPIQRVEMSLLGASATTHDAVTRIPGSFDRTMAAVDTFRRHEVPVKLYFTALSLNFREVVESKRLAAGLGCEFEWSSQVTPRDDRSVIPLTMRLHGEDMLAVQKQYVDEATAENGSWEASGYQNEGWFCGAGRHAFNITPYGDVQPCNIMRMDCGSIRRQPFAEIWRSAPEFLRLRAMRVADVFGCSDCKIRDYCAICPGLFYMEMGDVTIPSPHTCEQTEMKHLAATGTFIPAGSRDKSGEMPRPANAIFGGVSHQPVALPMSAPRG